MENKSERRGELWLITAFVVLAVLIVLRLFHHWSCCPSSSSCRLPLARTTHSPRAARSDT